MEKLIQSIYDIVWNPALIVLLAGAGLYFSVRSRFVQLRLLPSAWRSLFHPAKASGAGSISSFEAFCVAVSGRVGTGNIVGVATAIAIGGPGSVFWMWVIAFLGGATAFTEATLAQTYAFRYRGTLRGGPFAYIEKGLKLPFLAVLFALMTIAGYGLFVVPVQSNGVSAAFANSFGISPLLTGIVMTVLVAMVVIGGVKRIAGVASAIAPVMGIGYILISLVVVGANIGAVPRVLAMIVGSAFNAGPVFGGMIGSAIAMGVKRGLFSNEAGQGGGAIVAASAENDNPVQQGAVQALSVFVDTILVCTATALMILCTGCYNVADPSGQGMVFQGAPQLGMNYISFTQTAVDTVFHGWGGGFVSVALLLFAFTSLIAYYFYAESSLAYIFYSRRCRRDPEAADTGRSLGEKTALWIYRIAYLALIVLGTCTQADVAWMVGDIGLGITTWINVLALLVLFPQALRILADFEHGKD